MEETPETRANGTAPTADGWVLLREIGRGGASAVHEVLDEATGERLALKIALDTGPGGTPSADAVAREVEVLRGILHPHLVPVVGTAPTSAGPGILMEYLPGGSAADLVAARGPVGLGEAVTILAPVARALAHLHGAGAVHGDVSPANILFTAAGLPKLGDLGLAGLVGRHGPTGGTPGFSAPESVDESDRRLSPERDVFALGAVAWYLLTGRVPAATSHRPPLGSLVTAAPDEFALLLERCLSEDPALRPAAAEFAREVFRAAPPEPVSLTASVHPAALGHMVTVVGEGPGRPRRRRRSAPVPGRARPGISGRRRVAVPRAAAIAAAVAVLGVVGAAAAVFVQDQGPAGPEGPGGEGPRPTAVATAPAVSAPEKPGAGNAGTVAAVPADPGRAAVALAGLRDAALAGAEPGLLGRVHHPDGSSLAADEETVRSLRERGLRYDGLRTVLASISVAAGPSPGSVEVSAVSTIGPYRVLAADGRVVETVAEPTVQRVVLQLRRDDGGWLIGRVWEARTPAP